MALYRSCYKVFITKTVRWGCGEIGRRIGLKIQWPLGRAGSSPATPTNVTLMA